MALSVIFTGQFVIEETVSEDLSTPRDRFVYEFGDTLATGTGLDQADKLFHDTRPLAGTSEDFDLAAGHTSKFGVTITFVKIKMLFIKNRSTVAGETLAVGGAAGNQFINWVGDATDIINIQPNGFLHVWAPSLAGFAVTANTGDLLKIDSGAASFSFDIIIVGTSA